MANIRGLKVQLSVLSAVFCLSLVGCGGSSSNDLTPAEREALKKATQKNTSFFANGVSTMPVQLKWSDSNEVYARNNKSEAKLQRICSPLSSDKQLKLIALITEFKTSPLYLVKMNDSSPEGGSQTENFVVLTYAPKSSPKTTTEAQEMRANAIINSTQNQDGTQNCEINAESGRVFVPPTNIPTSQKVNVAVAKGGGAKATAPVDPRRIENFGEAPLK